MNTTHPILSAAIIGTGQIAGDYDRKRHCDDTGVYTHAGAYRSNEKFRLQTVCDIDPVKAEAFMHTWEAVEWTTDINLLSEQYHDVISICTPDKVHAANLLFLIQKRCCRTIFVEKPLAMSRNKIRKIISEARKAKIHIVVNYQRRFDCIYEQLRQRFGDTAQDRLLAANAYYIKGLLHIGTTMIDTLTAVCGYPEGIWAYNRVWNREIKAYTYEFILFYPLFNITVKTIDSNRYFYNYHIFELDFLLRDGRITLTDCTRYIETRSVSNFAYSGVNVINDGEPMRERTEFDQSMVKAIDYLYDITTGKQSHTVNRPEMSYNNGLILENIMLSYRSGRQISIKENEWMS